ncbi:shikimate dehydrogenase family protein [Emticicia sp. 17c]|uniref:shikimate dehydrogenase family protein n=1 Tax=Emticicia sp. 17c TaxID=3127704 RepID=UPI00301D5551
MNIYGLIGYPLGHSFSKQYFTEKFDKMGIAENNAYEKFELADIQDFPDLIRNQPDLRGLNVTIPHKQAVMPYLDGLDASAEKVGAVNVIKIGEGGKLIGYNSDYYGFKTSLEAFIPAGGALKALILGNGGAAKAVAAALKDLAIPFKVVSRTKSADTLTYDELAAELTNYQLIVNSSPVGTYPKSDVCPDIPYELLTPEHYLYDLVYNPVQTLFLEKGQAKGAKIHNGLKMLHLQAEKAWEIWNS